MVGRLRLIDACKGLDTFFILWAPIWKTFLVFVMRTIRDMMKENKNYGQSVI